MELRFENFLKNFAEAIEDESILLLNPETNFQELSSWDSFAFMSIIAMIDEKYGLVIKSDELIKALTFQEMFDLVNRKLVDG